MLRIQFNDTEVRSALRNLRTGVENPQAAWKAAAIIYYQHVSRAFRVEGDPDKWKPLAAATLKRRRRGKNKLNPVARILQDTGVLRGSATSANAAGGYLFINKFRMVIGSTLKYAGAQNYGHKQIPARPFFTITEPVKQRMRAAYLSQLVTHFKP